MENKSARAKVQAFGGFLTAMVIPNIGAFIAWGFIQKMRSGPAPSSVKNVVNDMP